MISKSNPSSVKLSDIASEAGVSTMTVSRVLNNKPHVNAETRERVLRIATSMGYIPHITARALSTGKSKMLGLVVGSISSEYLLEIIRGVSDETQAQGYNMVLLTSGQNRKNELTQVSYLMGGMVDGILLVLPREADRFLSVVCNQNLPCILIDHRSVDSDLPMVRAANRQGMYEAVRYLLQLNHHRIGFIKGIEGDGTSLERFQGYQDALLEAGISIDPDLVKQGDYESPSGERCATEMLSQENPPTAIVASNDQMAFGVLSAAHRLNLRVPEQLSVTGFDNVPTAAQVVPPLTTIYQPLYEMGREAVRMAVAAIQDNPVEIYTRIFPTRLVLRSSTGIAPVEITKQVQIKDFT